MPKPGPAGGASAGAGQKRRRAPGGAGGAAAGVKKAAPVPKSRAEQRAARKEHKMKHDPHFESVQQAKVRDLRPVCHARAPSATQSRTITCLPGWSHRCYGTSCERRA